MAESKERIDILLVEQGFFATREKAKAAVRAGLIYMDKEQLEKSGTKVPRDANIKVIGAPHPYVSRGGLKLEKALKAFSIELKDKVMIDVGASTGGFTDCALKNGISLVYAVDVGHDQLDSTLRNHPKVSLMERTNFRYMQLKDLDGPQPQFATIDVSFISLKHILPPLMDILVCNGEIVALIKPQFEAGKDKIGKAGIIKDHEIHKQVLLVTLHFATEIGLFLKGLTYSPITGGEGNMEFLANWTMEHQNGTIPAGNIDELVKSLVNDAWAVFN